VETPSFLFCVRLRRPDFKNLDKWVWEYSGSTLIGSDSHPALIIKTAIKYANVLPIPMGYDKASPILQNSACRMEPKRNPSLPFENMDEFFAGDNIRTKKRTRFES
jgi:hypothetical protein